LPFPPSPPVSAGPRTARPGASTVSSSRRPLATPAPAGTPAWSSSPRSGCGCPCAGAACGWSCRARYSSTGRRPSGRPPARPRRCAA